MKSRISGPGLRSSRRPARRSVGSHPAAVWAIKHVASPVDRFVVNVSGGRLRPPTSLAVPMLLLTTSGRRSGREHMVALVFVRDGDNYVVGNARPAGEGQNPWVLNLRAAGQGVVREGGRYVSVSAREIDGPALEQWWAELVAVWPAMADHHADIGERAAFMLEATQAARVNDGGARSRRPKPPWIVRRAARRELAVALGPERSRVIVACADMAYPAIAGHIPPTRAGARNLLKTSAYSIALHQAIIEQGIADEEATQLVSDVVFAAIIPPRHALYRLARLRHRDPLDRARWGARITRRLYYTAPDWVIDDVADDGLGFDVTRCVVDEFFRSLDMSELCQRVICDQDLRSAAHHGVVLDRTQTLSAGGDRCDFRYRHVDATSCPSRSG